MYTEKDAERMYFFSVFLLDIEILFDVIHEDTDRCRLEHGFFEDQMARAENGAFLPVVDHFSIHVGRAFGKQVCWNEGVSQALIDDFYAGQAI